MYETAVAAAYCFLFAGLYLLAQYVTSDQSHPWQAWMAGWCFGLTAGCRPNYALVAVMIAGAYWLYIRRGNGERAGFYRLAAPIVLCGLMLAWYNYARFGNPLNVGQSYQLVGSVVDRGVTTKISHLIPGLYRLLVQSPVWMRRFPFAELATPGDFGTEQFRPQYDHMEPIAGLLIISPLCFVGICLPFFLVWVRDRIPSSVRFVLVTMYVAALANLVAIVLTVNQVAQRYLLDFAPSLVLISLFVIVYIARTSRLITGILAGGVAASALIQAALSINGYDHSLMEENPSQFGNIAAIVGEDSRTTRYEIKDFSLTGEIAFPAKPAGKREALLTTGVRHRSDAVFIEYLGNNQLRFGCFSSGHPTYYGPDLAVAPGRTYRLRMDTRPIAEHVTIWLDDAVIVLSAPVSMYPTSVDDATLLTNHIGMPPNVQPFSGQFRSAKGLEIIPVRP
jgi:hypothetical protein